MSRFTARKTTRPTNSPARRPDFRPRLEALDDRCTPSAGALDPTFGGDGIATVAGTYRGRDVAVQPDGKVVAVGWTNGTGRDVKLVRMNADGTPDASFGAGGAVATDFQRGNDYGEAVAVLPNGQLLAAGTSEVYVKGVPVRKNELARYNPNGALDPTFGTKGKVVTDGTGGIRDIAVQPDGKILAVGSSGGGDLGLYRYNPNGTLDSTFGTGGKAVTDFFGLADAGHSLAVQDDAKVVVSGSATQSVGGTAVMRTALLRYHPDGTPDASFGAGGKVFSDAFNLTPGFEWPTPTVALQPDGGQTKVLLGGAALAADGLNDFLLARFNGDGSLDPTFGSGGLARSDFGGRNDLVHHLAVQVDGKVVAAGATTNSSTDYTSAIGLARYTADGAPDAAFGTGGLVSTRLDPRYGSQANAVAIQADGRIVVAGDWNNNLVLARYLASQPQIGTFTAGPNPVAAGGSVTLTASDVTDGNPNGAVTRVAFYADGDGDGVLQPGADTLLGYGMPDAYGTWTYTFATAGWAPGAYTLFARAVDTYGVFGDPVALTLEVV